MVEPVPLGKGEQVVSRTAQTSAGASGDDAPLLPPGRQLGPYTLVGELGRGGMAVVYRAHRDGLGRDVALKVIRPDQAASLEGLARFRREAQVASALTGHPGIVGVHDVGEADGLLYLAMDLIEGRSLYDLIEDELSPARAAEFVESAARAVHFAHTQGVLHRDIKPANILVTASGEVRLTDFGIARTQQASRDATQLTRAGAVIGSPDYMSPEQATGGPLDARSDVYSLGATLYECLTGSPPFNADSLQALVKQIVEDEVAPPRSRNPEVPRDLDVIACKCVAKEPEARYPTAEALADDLARARRGEAITARPLGVVARVGRRVRRNPAPYAAGVLVLLAIGAAGAIVAVRAARERASVDATFATARAILDGAPVQAMGLLEAVRQQDPGYPGLEAALVAARDRAAAREREAREAEAALLVAKGDDARDRFESAAGGPDAEAAWYQAWGFYAAARETLATRTDAPLHGEASGRLAALAFARLTAAERAGDAVAAARFLALVREYGAARYARALDGAGTLTLDTEPSGATVECFACVDTEGDGRLEEVPRDALGTTPLSRAPLPMGSYVLVLHKPGFHAARYPVLIERCEDDVVPAAVRLLPDGALDPEWVYIPTGESILGGDPEVAASGPRRRVDVAGFLLQHREVTIAEYAAFLNDLLTTHTLTDDEVTARCPRDSPRAVPYWRVRDGRLASSGGALADDWPALGVSWDDAVAYSEWRSRRDGVAVRLPTADEWERAARGADARVFPWGNRFAWASTVGGESPLHGGRPQPRAVLSATGDTSPFGVRDLAGSVCEWCAAEDGVAGRPFLGGGWGLQRAVEFRAAARRTDPPHIPTPMRGFRLARDLPPK